MNRKRFLSALSAFSSALVFPIREAKAAASLHLSIKTDISAIPPYLKPGDTLGITAPAGHITIERLGPAISIMESWGYKVKIGNTIGKQDFSFGGTDEERAADFQQMLDDPSIKAIMCARGGYGVVRIVDQLDWARFKLRPKWIIGFSDVTVLHSHIQRNCGIATIHSKMCNSFPDDLAISEPIQVQTIQSIQEALSGKQMAYTALPNSCNRAGIAEGTLVGGNLKVLETLSGTVSDINTAGKILFVEDTGEYLYSIDRMFWNLQRTGKLKTLKGLIVGGFNIKPDDEGEEFGRSLQEIILSKVKNYTYPVCFDFPVGHQRANFALKCGVKHRLKVTSDETTLIEIK
ncbi:LD-carboxypeptidase [Chitinophagaceae bacterium LB-8]|uniref:LD-carboxypeptidase n=1 Tax=Paraflavisolibacter caeni TaxID=2982496 RepID=A0A9X2XNE5_9BACT|nr:LD-carboxypeptidase [Paraflavisolibacter caeni]MCU7547994.1 LD-carboxypeptidase [Paraflavisolibacter caeni]